MHVRLGARSIISALGALGAITLGAVGCAGDTNRAPIAAAGADRTVTVGQTVTLDGSASADPEGVPLAFAWAFEEVPSGSGALLTDALTAQPTFTPDVLGTYLVTLTVTDGVRSATDGLSVTVASNPSGGVDLSDVDDRQTSLGEPIDVPLTITAIDAGAVTLAVLSSDAGLVVADEVEITGAGAGRSLRITPAPVAQGDVVITILALLGGALEDSVSFVLTVAPFASEPTVLRASDGAAGDRFGHDVGLSGGFLVVGAPGDDDRGADAGAAYVFRRSTGGWVQSTKLPGAGPPVVGTSAFDVASGDVFGSSVAIDGAFLAIGAPGDDDRGTDTGAVYVYTSCGPSIPPWCEVTKLTPIGTGAGDGFGTSVALSGDDLIVGAVGDDDLGTNAGAAYVFRRNGDVWSQVEKLVDDGTDIASALAFGTSVSISGDYAIVGTDRSQLAYLFGRNGSDWVPVDTFTEAETDNSTGRTVAIHGDDAILGSFRATNLGSDAGLAYVAQRDGLAWDLVQTLSPDDPSGDQMFGTAVAIRGDLALVGSGRLGPDGLDTGYVYVIQREAGAWRQIDKLVGEDAAPRDDFGFSLAMGDDEAVVGTPGDADGGEDVGSVAVFLE